MPQLRTPTDPELQKACPANIHTTPFARLGSKGMKELYPDIDVRNSVQMKAKQEGRARRDPNVGPEVELEQCEQYYVKINDTAERSKKQAATRIYRVVCMLVLFARRCFLDAGAPSQKRSVLSSQYVVLRRLPP